MGQNSVSNATANFARKADERLARGEISQVLRDQMVNNQAPAADRNQTAQDQINTVINSAVVPLTKYQIPGAVAFGRFLFRLSQRKAGTLALQMAQDEANIFEAGGYDPALATALADAAGITGVT